MPLAHYPLRADILKPKVKPNYSGTPKDEFEPWLTGVPVYFETIKGKDFWEAQREFAEITARIRLRFIPGIKNDMAVKLKGRIFQIIPPINNVGERNKELILAVKEVI